MSWLRRRRLRRSPAVLPAAALSAEQQVYNRIVEAEGRRLEADRWNAYFTTDRPRFNLMPNAFLIQMAERRPPGTALDMGMGMGR